MLIVSLNRSFKPAYIIDNWTKSLIKYFNDIKCFDYSKLKYTNLNPNNDDVIFKALYRGILKPKDLNPHFRKRDISPLVL